MAEEVIEAIKTSKPADQRVSSLVANNPDSPMVPEIRSEIEAEIKAELLKDVSLEEIRELVGFVRNGGLKKSTPNDHPDEFDESGRNYRRMVHRVEVTGPSGNIRYEERPFANSREESRKSNPPLDYYDLTEGTWILYGYKRQKDREENTVGYEGAFGR